jgi:hypothetical protein
MLLAAELARGLIRKSISSCSGPHPNALVLEMIVTAVCMVSGVGPGY